MADFRSVEVFNGFHDACCRGDNYSLVKNLALRYASYKVVHKNQTILTTSSEAIGMMFSIKCDKSIYLLVALERVEHGLHSIQPKSDRTFSRASEVTPPQNVTTVSVRSPRGGVSD
jgi:hypothetical protein